MLVEDEEEDEVNDDDVEKDEEDVEMPLVRTRRYIRIPHSGQSPHNVGYAANYDANENRGWVKPLFSSIVYRLPVNLNRCSLKKHCNYMNRLHPTSSGDLDSSHSRDKVINSIAWIFPKFQSGVSSNFTTPVYPVRFLKFTADIYPISEVDDVSE